MRAFARFQGGSQVFCTGFGRCQNLPCSTASSEIRIRGELCLAMGQSLVAVGLNFILDRIQEAVGLLHQRMFQRLDVVVLLFEAKPLIGIGAARQRAFAY